MYTNLKKADELLLSITKSDNLAKQTKTKPPETLGDFQNEKTTRDFFFETPLDSGPKENGC